MQTGHRFDNGAFDSIFCRRCGRTMMPVEVETAIALKECSGQGPSYSNLLNEDYKFTSAGIDRMIGELQKALDSYKDGA